MNPTKKNHLELENVSACEYAGNILPILTTTSYAMLESLHARSATDHNDGSHQLTG